MYPSGRRAVRLLRKRKHLPRCYALCTACSESRTAGSAGGHPRAVTSIRAYVDVDGVGKRGDEEHKSGRACVVDPEMPMEDTSRPPWPPCCMAWRGGGVVISTRRNKLVCFRLPVSGSMVQIYRHNLAQFSHFTEHRLCLPTPNRPAPVETIHNSVSTTAWLPDGRGETPKRLE